MPTLFISHSSQDDDRTALLRDALTARGFDDLFVDFDPDQGIPTGRDWQGELHAQLQRCDGVIFLTSAASKESKWCHTELAIARQKAKPIFPVLLDGKGVMHELLTHLQGVEWPRNEAKPPQRLFDNIVACGLDPDDQSNWDAGRSPYPGLRYFGVNEAAVFFGRDDLVKALRERIDHPILRGLDRFVAVLGPSGSGKSSVVRAGLIPLLMRSGEWLTLPPVEPRDRPIESLARSFAKCLGPEPEPLNWKRHRDRLMADPSGAFHDLLDSAGGDKQHVLLFIDQAEELVATPGQDAPAAFLSLLADALNGGSHLSVVAAFRSEFLTQLLHEVPDEALLADPVLVSPLDRGRLGEVITRPAQRAGLAFEAGLVDRMVSDTGDGAALPLLAFTLRRLFEARDGAGLIDLRAYDAMGGVVGALKGELDRTRRRLDLQHWDGSVVETLLQLVTMGDTGEPTRRRVLRSSLPAASQEIADSLIESRILVSEGLAEDVVVDVAHEAVLGEWVPLASAIDRNRAALEMRTRVQRDASFWDAAGRDDDWLYRGGQLEKATSAVYAADGVELPRLVANFLDRSREVHFDEFKAGTSPTVATAGQADQIGGYETRVLGQDPAQSLHGLRTGLERARATARVEFESETRGSGVLIRGDLLHQAWPDEPLLVTATSVVGHDPWGPETIELEGLRARFEALDPRLEYQVSELLFSSPPYQTDCTVFRLEDAPRDIEDVPIASRLPTLGEARLNVLGHPGGRSLALSEGLMLDHDLVRIHHRAATEGGSGGGPVFDARWRLVGIHHAGSFDMPRLGDKGGTYPANEAIWIQAIRDKIADHVEA